MVSQSTAPTPEDRMWSLYITEADKVDEARMENWKGDMDAILIFSGLFSAVITAFIIESYQNLQQDPADVTVLLLAQISMQLAANASSPVPALSPAAIPFHPNTSTQTINALWFLSLFFSLTCALLATLVQQWARQYLQVIRKLKGKKDRAALRAFVARGHQRYRARHVVKAMPALLHVSLLLFLVGLVQFLYTVNKVVALVALIPTALLFFIYFSITILSAWFLDCPYQTPLSFFAWRVIQSPISTTLYGALSRLGAAMVRQWARFFLVIRLRRYWDAALARIGGTALTHREPKPEMARRRETAALEAFKDPQAQSRALEFVREGLVGREEYLSFFVSVPQFLKAPDGWEAMACTQNQWVGVWCSFPPSDVGGDATADLAWLRSLFAMVSQNIVTFPKLLHTIWGISKQIQLGRVNYLDSNFPPELQIFKAIKRIRDQNRPQLAAHYAILCDFMISKQSRTMVDTWSDDVAELLNLPLTRSDWPDSLPGTEGAAMLQAILRFLTSRAFLAPSSDVLQISEGDKRLVSILESFTDSGLDGGLDIASFASQLFKRNRSSIFAHKFANPHRHGQILNQSQRTQFLESVRKLLAQGIDAQTPSLSLSTLGHFYVFDIVREYNSRPQEVGEDGLEEDLGWVVAVREAYDDYLKKTPDLGELKQHFDRLGNSFPYADPVSSRTGPLAEALGMRPTPNPEGLAPKMDNSIDEAKLAPPQSTHAGDSYSTSGVSLWTDLASNDERV
ncbi:hypothetical protein HWV62_39890 [Athelia sp. TMB]|nr:hypothetical protein HWV62_39890 [Athelia sp. TMB]